MDTQKLAKIIKLVVEQELKRQLPHLIDEGVKKVLRENKQLVKSPVTKQVNEDVDPFALANSILEKNRQFSHNHDTDDEEYNVKPTRSSQQVRQFTKNPVLNEVLNSTKPFSQTERMGGPQSVLDKFTPEPLNENFNDMDKTVSFGTNGAQGGMDVIKAQMAAKMGYGGYTNPNGEVPKTGLGVTTGLPGLDRILNRDNSELVKKFKTR